MNNKDMFYNMYEYGTSVPLSNGGFGVMPNMNQIPQIPANNYSTGQFNDMNERIGRLERQVKRLEQRLTRLETPYANNQYNNEPDNNMYMM